MTIADIITRAVPALAGLSQHLESQAAQYPDLEPQLRPKIDALKAAADPGRLAALAKEVVGELAALVGSGKIDPRSHPSDVAP